MVTDGKDRNGAGKGDSSGEPGDNVIQFPVRIPQDGVQEELLPSGQRGERESESDPTPIQTKSARRRQRRETVLLAELRGWGSISERIGPAQAERALSNAVDRAIASLLTSEAEEPMIEGDPTQPALSGVFLDPDSCVRALRAAADLRHAVAEAQFPAPAENQFRIGIGLDSGDVTSITNEDDVTFEAVGPVRMFAAKLRDFAGAGQVFMSADVYLDARDLVHVRSLGQVRVNTHGDTREAFSLTGFQDQ
jgi:class 3 adenylate cyclase